MADSTDSVHQEIDAIGKCIAALLTLPEDGQQRALRYLQERFPRQVEPPAPRRERQSMFHNPIDHE